MDEKEEELKHLHPDTFKQRCHLALPTHPHIISPRPNKNTNSNCFTCEKQLSISFSQGFHYHCTICDVDFHEYCVKYPRKITHPFHLQHPLFFTLGKHENIFEDGNIRDQGTYKAPIANSNSSTSDLGKCNIFDNCTWCGNYIPSPSLNPKSTVFYKCSICSFCLDIPCAHKNPPLTIENPKSHHHSLTFFPRPVLVPCDACGLVNVSEPSYACFQCNYMVHQFCVDLPRVIKITRHPQHRLSYSPYLPLPDSFLCRVCYRTVDNKYGLYSCKDEGCSYILHSKCATHVMVWDGKELEWEPEEEVGVIEDTAPFKDIGDGLIQHFGHEHHLKLEKYDSARDIKKQCQACVLPIVLDDFYNCIECDFFLHVVCAGLPKKVDHALHNHSIFLDPSPLPSDSKLQCSACSRVSTGFRYKCMEKTCMMHWFQIDVCCFLVPEYVTEKVHEHPLFIAPYNYDHEVYLCNGCKRRLTKTRLQCTLCEVSICYECATIPKELHYRYDEHPLILCYGEEDTDDKYWCEECEKELNPSEWFYTCNKCCITIHRECVFGFHVYLKAGYTIKYNNAKVEVVGNISNTRPACSRCEDRCPGSTYYKVDLKTVCSRCLLAPPKR